MEHYSHGEVNIFRACALPKGINRIKGDGKKYIVADSETSGNHHCVEEKEGVEMYEKDGVLYLKNTVPTDVFCMVKDRHDTITLEPGIWEIDRAQEWDYLTQQRRSVSD